MLTVSVLVGGCSSAEGRTGQPPTLDQVRALLVRHAAAVRAHSAPAFLADVDRSWASSAFRARQSEQIDNISDVPLAAWTYAVAAPVTDASAQQAASRRYRAPALIVQVTVSYALAGVDDEPTPHDLWWTFVRRGGHVELAGDDDLAQAGGASWRGPWDFGPVVAVRGASTLVLGHLASSRQLSALADAVDAAVPAVTAVWGAGWSQHVAVLVPADAAEFAALVGAGTTGSDTTGADVSAVAVTDGVDPLSHQPYGQRLVLEPTALATLTAVGERIVVRHEITHLATAAVTADTTPRWLVEGFADYVAQRDDWQAVPAAASELRAEVARGVVPTALPGDADFAVGAPQLPQVYEQSWLACRLIAARVGTAGLVAFYRQVGRAAAPPGYAVTQALHEVLQVSVATFTAQWRAYLKAELA